jgi:catechol 2,3-dioxygenase-like lactoylglutathione lyase family enzyme
MASVTVGVSSLDDARRLFVDAMGLTVEFDAELSDSLAAAWHLPNGHPRRLMELSCRGYPIGRLRLLQCAPDAPRMRDDHGGGDSGVDVGPKAIDFYVRDPLEKYLQKIEQVGCRRRSEPVRHATRDYDSEEVVISGPDGVPMLLMVGHRHKPEHLRDWPADVEYSEIATTSVVCGDLAASRKFYSTVLGMKTSTDSRTRQEDLERVADLTGTPRGEGIHFLVFKGKGEPSGKTLLVHFYGSSGKRLVGRSRPGHLGVSLFSYRAPELEALRDGIEAFGLEVLTGPTDVEGPYGPERLMLAAGPNEELFEFVA